MYSDDYDGEGCVPSFCALRQVYRALRNRREETKKEAAVSASVCQLAPGSGESTRPRASCSTRSSLDCLRARSPWLIPTG